MMHRFPIVEFTLAVSAGLACGACKTSSRAVAPAVSIEPPIAQTTVAGVDPVRLSDSVIQSQIVATRASGDVKIDSGGNAKVLANQEPVPRGARVRTGLASGVVLVFSNGTTLSLAAETELVVEQFLQDPFSSTVQVAARPDEPTISKVVLRLNRGEVVGNIKKLNVSQGSSFELMTPVGKLTTLPEEKADEDGRSVQLASGGGIVRVAFRPTGSGAFKFSVSAAAGRLVFRAPDGGRTVVVAPGEEVVVDVSVTNRAGALTVGVAKPAGTN